MSSQTLEFAISFQKTLNIDLPLILNSQHLIWVCTVYLHSTNRMFGVYGLSKILCILSDDSLSCVFFYFAGSSV